jgi:5-methylthioadenosine/S-adenosylhomocysteine deaminase
MGLMGPDLIGAHCIFNTGNDLETMREANASILHCPRPYLLGGTTAPLARWLSLGIKVGLGTDNVYHSMWETMRAALYGARIKEGEGEPASPTYYKILELATIDGAKVIGMEDKVGSIEPGKKADIQLINLRHPHLLPTVDITSSLVLYGGTANVDTVIVDGKIVKQNGALTMKREDKILEEAQNNTTEIWDKLFTESPGLRDLMKSK